MEDGLKRMYRAHADGRSEFLRHRDDHPAEDRAAIFPRRWRNLAGVLRDRKRLQGKIRAMSSEAKAGAMIIGSLPPGVMALVYITTPDYIKPLFTVELGNLMLIGCVVWMAIGILVMKKMVSFKYLRARMHDRISAICTFCSNANSW